MLTREQILSADDAKYEDVDVPEWGGTVRVKAITAKERDEFESKYLSAIPGKAVPTQFRAPFVVMTAVDDTGKRLFTDADIAALEVKSASAIERLFDVAIRLAKMRKQDRETVKND